MTLELQRLHPADDWVPVWEDIATLATRIADTDLVPKEYRGEPAQVAALILKGRELGMPPMMALSSCFVIGGRVSLKAETMRALVLRAGHELWYSAATGVGCTACGRRKGSDITQEVTITIDMATQAGWAARNPVYRSMPRAMLKARATTELCRDLFPDVIGGLPGVEELQDMPAGEEPKRARAKREQLPAAVPVAVDTTPPPPLPDDDDSGPPDDWPALPMTAAQRGLLWRLADQRGLKDDRDARLAQTSAVLQHTISSWADLTTADASKLIDAWQDGADQ